MGSQNSSILGAPAFPLPKLPAMDNTLGAWLLGTAGCLLLQGLIYHQTFRYFRVYSKDPWFLKLWVCTGVVIETVNTVLYLHAAYYYMVTNYSDPLALAGNPVWSLKIEPIPGCLSAILAELFFARRVWLIGRQFRPLVIVMISLSFASLGFFTALIALGYHATSVDAFLRHSWLAALGCSCFEAGDLMVTIVLIYVLRKHRTGLKSTNSLIDTLIKYAVTTGLLICIVQVFTIISVLVWPRTWIFAAVDIVLSKLSTTCFLVALNSRHSLGMTDIVDETTPFTSTFMRGKSSTTPMRFATPAATSQFSPSAESSAQNTVDLRMNSRVGDNEDGSQSMMKLSHGDEVESV